MYPFGSPIMPTYVFNSLSISLHLFGRFIHLIRSYYFLVFTFRTFSEATGTLLIVRIAIDSGSIVSGIVGIKKWHYDIVGKTVDNAIRMRQSTAAMPKYVCFVDFLTKSFRCFSKILISAATNSAIDDDHIRCEPVVDVDSRTIAFQVVGTSFKVNELAYIGIIFV